MANEIRFDHTSAGLSTLYAVMGIGNTIVSATGGAALPLSSSNWAAGAILLSDSAAAGRYFGSVPSGTVAGMYSVVVASNSSPQLSDPNIGTGILGWSGSREASLAIAIALPDPAPSGYGPAPAVGLIAINHDTSGADNLRFVDGLGSGIEGADVMIYLAGDWPNNPASIQARATTRADGRWNSPAYVTAGTYVAVFSKPGFYDASASAAFTV